MSNSINLKGAIKERKDKKLLLPDQQPMEIVTLEAPENPPCFTCKKKPKRDGSKYCGKCSINYHSGI